MAKHPSTETLLDLTLDDLPESRASEIREHLIACAECREKIRLLLDEPDGPPPFEEPLTREEKAEAWWRLSQSIQVLGADENSSAEPAKATSPVGSGAAQDERPTGDSGPTQNATPGPFTHFGSGSGPRIVGTAAAAAVFAFGVGLFVGGGSETGSMRIGAWTALEGERSMSRGATESLLQVSCPLADGDFIWSLPLPVGTSTVSAFYLEIERPDGEVEGGMLAHQDDLGQILITRPRSRTPDGHYVIRVWDADRVSVLETLRFHVICDEHEDRR